MKRLGIKPGSMVLDVGSGTGVLLPLLLNKTEQSGRIIALDIAEEMIRKAKDKCLGEKIYFIHASVNSIPLRDEIFDAVTIVSTLDHIEDPTPVLKEAKRVLKRGGRIFIQNSIREEGINPWHLHTWTKEELIELVNEVFTVVDTKVIENPKMGDNIFIKGTKK